MSLDCLTDKVAAVVEDEWDAEGFEIPSLSKGKSEEEREVSAIKSKDSLRTASEKVKKVTEKIYLGPHGAPPSQAKHSDANSIWKRPKHGDAEKRNKRMQERK